MEKKSKSFRRIQVETNQLTALFIEPKRFLSKKANKFPSNFTEETKAINKSLDVIMKTEIKNPGTPSLIHYSP